MFHRFRGSTPARRTLLAATAAATLALGATACGSSDDDGGSKASSGGDAAQSGGSASGKKVAFLTVTEQCDYCARAIREFQRVAQDAGIKVETKTTDYDAAEQADQVNQAVAQRPDAIVYWPADATASIPSLNRIKAAGIPVVVMNSSPGPQHEALWTAFTGPNDEQLGELAAKGMIEGFEAKGEKPEGNIFVVLGQPGSPPAIQRLAGFKKTLAADAPGVKIVGEQPGNWDQTEATKAADGLFTANAGKNIKGVYAQADNMAAGVVVAAKRRKLDPKDLVIVGGNCQPEGLRNIGSGDQYSSVLQSPVDDGRLAAEAVVNILSGKDQAKETYLPHEVITKENLATCEKGVG